MLEFYIFIFSIGIIGGVGWFIGEYYTRKGFEALREYLKKRRG